MFQNIKGRIDAARINGVIYKQEELEAKLGFKGFLVGFLEAAQLKTELIVGPNTLELQKLLLQTMPDDMKLDKELLVKEIERGKAPVKGRKKRAAPVFNAAPWNAVNRVGLNNCYNYRTIKQTDTQPGRAGGQPHPFPLLITIYDKQQNPMAWKLCRGHLLTTVNSSFHLHTRKQDIWWHLLFLHLSVSILHELYRAVFS